MEAFRKNAESKIEHASDAEAIEKLIEEFPEPLQDRLWEEVHEFDDRTARDYLISKLIDRKMALLPSEYREIPKTMEVVNENPEAVQESINRAHEEGSTFFLGAGQNGEVVASTRQEGVCYKTLFMERANSLGANIAREALVQYAVYELLSDGKFAHMVPKVHGFVKTPEAQAIKMDKIEGFDLRRFFDDPHSVELPENFDPEVFFETLAGIIEEINSHGYFHRDLVGNGGNVICDEKGMPVLIDFGSAIKAINYDPDEAGYQIVPGGQYYIANDLSAVADLKNRFMSVYDSIQAE